MKPKPAPKASSNATFDPDPHVWIQKAGIRTTADVKVPERLIEQVIGQEDAVEVAVKASEQRRHLLLIGDPGTGKSMLAKALAEILPRTVLPDLLVHHNEKSPNTPKVVEVPGATGRARIQEAERKARRALVAWRIMEYLVSFGVSFFGFYMWYWRDESLLVFLFCILIALIFLYASSQKRPKIEYLVPKLLLERPPSETAAPYMDATGAHAGALLGDVRHDPYQSGGLETPPHSRVELGAIHRAHKGVLFIDEINVLRLPSQQALLTAIQEGKYAIVGQSQSSAGAMVKTDPVPCDFVLVAAGNLDAVRTASEDHSGGMHPALRSRIRGYGYEVYVNSTMDDTHANRMKLVRFVAQEVARDGRIPHFDAAAVAEVIREAQRRSGQSGKLTLRLRELGGLVRTAGDYARGATAPIVTLAHVRAAKKSSRSLEQQITEAEILRRARQVRHTSVEGRAIGFANGTASIGTGEVGEPAGVVVHVEAVLTPAISRQAGSVILGHRLKRVPDWGVENVGAILKTMKGEKITAFDLHLDASINHPDADAEGIGLAAAAASISAVDKIPLRQDVVMVASVAPSGDLRPVEFTLQQIEAGVRAGCKVAIVPEDIRDSLLVDDDIKAEIHIVFLRTLAEAMLLAGSKTAPEPARAVNRAPPLAQGVSVRPGNRPNPKPTRLGTGR